ncbi:MAG: hypothetical protein KDA24_16250, partial [Deltaproteobacteria bacterium]|nr:hypothetical protein [Deltaproteobacteria bacterium]
MKRTTWMAGAITAALLASGCGGCGDKDEAVEVTPEPTPEVVAEPTTPADERLAALATLTEQVAGLPPVDSEDRARREVFRRDALTLGNEAITELRFDVVVGVGEVLWGAGEPETAAAYLQRSVGMTREKSPEKSHLRALARLKVDGDAALEAASLMERAIDIEPTTPEDFVL